MQGVETALRERGAVAVISIARLLLGRLAVVGGDRDHLRLLRRELARCGRCHQRAGAAPTEAETGAANPVGAAAMDAAAGAAIIAPAAIGAAYPGAGAGAAPAYAGAAIAGTGA